MCCYSAHTAFSKGMQEFWVIVRQLYLSTFFFINLLNLWFVPAAGDPEVCAEMGGVRQSAAQGLEGALDSDSPADVAADFLHSHRNHSMRNEIRWNGKSIKTKCICFASVFVLALLSFGGRFFLSPTKQSISAVSATWPEGPPKTVQNVPGPGPFLWATTVGRKCLAVG